MFRPDVFNSVAFISYVYYNADLVDGFAGEERHGVTMDGMTHKLLHYSIGTQYKSGFDISDYVLKSDTVDDTTYALTEGEIFDEDILITVPEQVLNSYVIFYKLGLDGDWNWQTNSVPYLYSNDNLLHNEFDGYEWRLSEITTNNYTNSYILCNL